nr:putative short-chain dehydrogenase/reductase [uncultured bacterium]
MDIRLDGRVALVTGAGEGIGRGCALALAACGAEVWVNDINPTTGEDTAATIRNQGRQARFVQADVSDEAAVAAMFAQVGVESPALHILVNNAGFNLFKGIQETTLEEWNAIFNVDAAGVYLVTKAALPLLQAARGASVVNIASVHASLTIANITAYAGAKGAVVSLSRSLAQELGPMGIRVNCVSPGFMETPLLDRWLASEPDAEATMARVNGYHPLGRIGRPEDIGHLVSFLASDLSGFITGANIVIDGGLTTRLMH